jgi:fructan beta-fructosidase
MLMEIFRLTFLLVITAAALLGQTENRVDRTKYYPEYHYYPSADPTGLFYFGGQYYLNWGSARSTDFVHWKLTEYGKERNSFFMGSRSKGQAIQRKPQVLGGISGTVVVDWKNTSGFGVHDVPPLVVHQITNIAYSNDTARTWIRYEKPAVIENSSGTFRDAKTFWYEPEKQWIMVLGWADIQKVKFFSSKDLKDWKYMSEFGPWGAVKGEWECVDFFPLPVDGDSSHMKWILTVSLQPSNGQYFIGDFDGKRFVLDRESINALTYDPYFPAGQMLFNFENGIDDWKMEGDAFLECPTNSEKLHGHEGLRYISSAHNGASSKGKLTSPEFTISKNCLNFIIGGGYYPNEECVNLLVGGTIVRTQTGNSNSTNMTWKGWDVSEFRGKKAWIEIIDNISEGRSMVSRGFIYCDALMLCDELPKYEYNDGWEKAFWVDWGPDFYAVRSWNNYAPEEKRHIWVGWMGIWKYAFTEPLLGLFSVPRSLELKTFPEGIKLIQKPIAELESLRISHHREEDIIINGTWKSKNIVPSKNSYELIAEFENISAEEFGLNLCVGKKNYTRVGYNNVQERLYVDRRHSGYDDFSGVFPVIHTGPLKNRTSSLKLHIFVDKCSVEVFGNDGETVISSKIYPDPSNVSIDLFSSKGTVKIKSIDLWELRSIDLY